jgi:oligopeptidase B
MTNQKILSLLLILNIAPTTNPVLAQHAPVADKVKKELVHHGHERIDYYNWMTEGNPKVIEHLKEENEYAKQILKPTEKLQKALYNEMVGRVYKTQISAPYWDNGYFYYTRYDEGKDYPTYLRKEDVSKAEEEVILDVNKLAAGHSYFDISNFLLNISTDNNLMAVAFDTVGGWYTLRIKDLSTGEWLEDEIPNTTGDHVWANDNKTVFYSIPDSAGMSTKVKRHHLGESYLEDTVVFHEKDHRFDLFVFKSKSKKYIVIRSLSTLTIDNLILNADDPSGEFKAFQPREEGLEYYIRHFEDKFYIRTNYNAVNFRVMVTPEDKTGKENWKEVIPHRPEVLIYKVEVFKDFLAIDEMINGLTEIEIINLKNSTSNYITFEEEVYSAKVLKRIGYFSTNFNFESEWLKYDYSSLTTPRCIYEYHMPTGERRTLNQSEILGSYDPSDYESKRLYADATDGKKVPISLVYKKGLILNGKNPLLLDAYGAYGGWENVSISSKRISLLDRGFVFAIAHVRGGAEMGREWYEDGKLLNKKNTFTDFIACAEHLIGEEYTNSDKLFAQGGSMGGLLMGAVANMRPDLFKGMIATVPVPDLLTSMFDESMIYEYDEIGNPNIKKHYDYILSYSPYDNVGAKDYPVMLILTGIYDSYWTAAKWACKLRGTKTDDKPLLLYTNMNAGHYGSTGRLEKYKQTAMEYAFLLNLAGVTE